MRSSFFGGLFGGCFFLWSCFFDGILFCPFFGRDFFTFFAGFGETDGDGLFPACYCLSASAAFELSAFSSCIAFSTLSWDPFEYFAMDKFFGSYKLA